MTQIGEMLPYTANAMPVDALVTWARASALSRHGIDPQNWNILSPASKDLMAFFHPSME